MTDPLFFDTDCLSAFLWINNQSLLAQLYPGRIVIPSEVYAELSRPSIPHLKMRVDSMIRSNVAQIESIQTGSAEYTLYRKLVSKPDPGHMIIGKGEAAAIALAKEQGGVLASNNLKDISVYVFEYGLRHKTTGDILKEALDKGLITEDEGNQLWQDMINKRRKLVLGNVDTDTDHLRHLRQKDFDAVGIHRALCSCNLVRNKPSYGI